MNKRIYFEVTLIISIGISLLTINDRAQKAAHVERLSKSQVTSAGTELRRIRAALIIAKVIPEQNSSGLELDVRIENNWSFGDIIWRDVNGEVSSYDSFLLQQEQGEWVPVAIGPPILWDDHLSQMDQATKIILAKWEAEHL